MLKCNSRSANPIIFSFEATGISAFGAYCSGFPSLTPSPLLPLFFPPSSLSTCLRSFNKTVILGLTQAGAVYTNNANQFTYSIVTLSGTQIITGSANGNFPFTGFISASIIDYVEVSVATGAVGCWAFYFSGKFYYYLSLTKVIS
jgi:hypothetical protein